MGKGLCTPLVIYIVLCFIGIILHLVSNVLKGGNIQANILLSHVGMNLLFGGLMFILCKVGLVGLSWVILLMPIIMGIISLVLLLGGGMVLLSVLKNKDHKKKDHKNKDHKKKN